MISDRPYSTLVMFLGPAFMQDLVKKVLDKDIDNYTDNSSLMVITKITYVL